MVGDFAQHSALASFWNHAIDLVWHVTGSAACLDDLAQAFVLQGTLQRRFLVLQRGGVSAWCSAAATPGQRVDTEPDSQGT